MFLKNHLFLIIIIRFMSHEKNHIKSLYRADIVPEISNNAKLVNRNSEINKN